MRRLVGIALAFVGASCPSFAQTSANSVVVGKQPFVMKVLATGLQAPWEITWGPDNFLWVTDRRAGRITRIDPKSGVKKTATTLTDVSTHSGQDGLLGMALDPGLLKGTGHDYVYVAYTYVDRTRGPHDTVVNQRSPYRFLYAKIVRLVYHPAEGRLSGPVVVLIDGLPASRGHNSGRMKIGPDGKLYYTIGDQENNELGNFCVPIEAQRLPTAQEVAAKNWVAYQGKSLRMNLDGSIPSDNPVIDGVRSHVFTYGHRNMQGIDFAPDGRLYASEQGPKTDDEVNILVPGRNYGWPHVAGFRDDKAYQYARWADASKPCKQLRYSDITIDPSVPREDETSWKHDFEPPIATLF